ncbi:MAG: potassium-transporting ATPase subunit F [Gammaproteobacteria bacterium]|nr:potassium-transporting ATPase subunit F [Gammaproteobacteria bacterium]
MMGLYLTCGLITFSLLVYLLIVLFKPELF